MLEKRVEQRLVHKINELGGLCWKFTSPGTDGVPDRIILYKGRCVFVELKRPGAKPDKIQLYRHQQIGEQNFPVYVIDRPEQVDEFVGSLKGVS